MGYVSGYKDVDANEYALKYALAYQPVSVAVMAG
eukprot:CAMPEP_0201281122 /NCGR_PEP_ID=MMETSP1317-20130820/1492_1 /ASSEMBLY_ACC=CAM_ASM_000770 /TAXON_ID=187299 /ORGANISM="Undescribed Undescribed, Strain Undescribed" /LENGTH=33 /DNA_ID= /DNA_START= /DNA_END= /DNA_ORIENTATION=